MVISQNFPATSLTPGKTGGMPMVKSPKVVGLLPTISYSFFIVALLLSGGVFLYKQYLTEQVSSLEESLEKKRASFDSDEIQKFISTDRRVNMLKGLLETHVAPGPFFDFLGSLTLGNVRYTAFDLGADGSSASLILKGEARDFSAIALQSDVMNASTEIINPTFSNIAKNRITGLVEFSFSAGIASEVVRYKFPDDSENNPVIENSNNVSSTTPIQN